MKPKKKRFIKSGCSKKGYSHPRRGKHIDSYFEDGVGGRIPMKHVHRKAQNIVWRDDDRAYANYDFIYRFLDQNIGRPWDDVYSEICKECDDRTFAGNRVRDILEWNVETNCYIDGDEIRTNDGRLLKSSSWSRTWYVHPKSGKLQKFDVKKSQRRKLPKQIFECDGKYYHNHEDIWYQVEMKEKSSYDRYGWDAFCRDYSECRFYGLSPDGKAWFPETKRSANSKEIKKLMCFIAA